MKNKNSMKYKNSLNLRNLDKTEEKYRVLEK
jgi:hypothetical protein